MLKPFQRRSALAEALTPGTYGSAGPTGPMVTIQERHPLDLVHISGPADGNGNGSGLPLPAVVNSSTEQDGVTFLWLGPGRALAVSEQAGLLARLEKKVSDGAARGYALNDVSSGRSVLRLQGTRARDVLQSGTPIDLHEDAFPIGAAAPTLHGTLNVVIHNVAETTFDIYIARSMAMDLCHAMTNSAREWGYTVPSQS